LRLIKPDDEWRGDEEGERVFVDENTDRFVWFD
jgi:hypothetical protein